nr:hypothetical protein Itr_chr08CG17220 [Ipomoea trifida]
MSKREPTPKTSFFNAPSSAVIEVTFVQLLLPELCELGVDGSLVKEKPNSLQGDAVPFKGSIFSFVKTERVEVVFGGLACLENIATKIRFSPGTEIYITFHDQYQKNGFRVAVPADWYATSSFLEMTGCSAVEKELKSLFPKEKLVLDDYS